MVSSNTKKTLALTYGIFGKNQTSSIESDEVQVELSKKSLVQQRKVRLKSVAGIDGLDFMEENSGKAVDPVIEKSRLSKSTFKPY